ncbi:hypothetical protein QCA50_009798 [Cerrena zonata]|uniref:Actin interacting protein 3 C-terminal domain-containing protein n=1 Tax=Cerrena zonata TaxID=2478898 RepID=A0AAW0G0M7_9APHY
MQAKQCAQSPPAVESTVTRLLVSIKQLLESLTQWSKGLATESQVSDVYVRLGNDFNAAVAAFAAFNIDMAELLSVPDDLRIILEQCLAEDATPENLEIYLPDVRKIITNLLQGLRTKQHLYRKISNDHKHQSSASSASDRPESTVSSNRKSTRSQIDPSDSQSRRSAQMSRRKESSSVPRSFPDDRFIGGFAVASDPPSEPVPQRSSTPKSQPQTPRSATQRLPTGNTNGYPPSRASSASASIPIPREPPVNGTPEPLPPPPLSQEETSSPSSAPPRPPSVYAPVPSHIPRFSLSDNPISSTPPPAVVIDEAPPSNDDTPIPKAPGSATPSPVETPAALDVQAPEIKSSLTALKNRDVLERRASKRFSTYNISKMTGGSVRSGGAGGSRMSMAASSALTPGDLAALTEHEEGPMTPSKRDRNRGTQRARPPSTIAEDEEVPPPVPPLPSREVSPQKPSKLTTTVEDSKPSSVSSYSPSPVEPASKTLTVFLQVGKEVKKVQIEPGLSFSSLRVLFVDKFSYSPGKDNFPAIYIRDPSTGVQYELEDMDEVKDKSLLSLNIEPLDQIKQHIDSQIGSLSQDIKDLRTMVVNGRRASVPPPMIIGQPIDTTPGPPRPSEKTFRNVARQIARILPEGERTPQQHRPEPLVPQMTGTLQPQMTGASVMSEYSSRVVLDLKTQFDEVQNLRRDLGIMRQLYNDFIKQTKESLGTLRTQTQNVRQLASAKVGGARAYIDDGKTKLDARSQNVLTKMEELQDLVEGIKDDVLKRNVSPRPQVLKNIKADVDSVNAELQNLKDHIQTVKPMWKKTWEEELQNIVEEQQFLTHQEEFLSDLLEDHKAVIEVFGHVEKVISLRGPGGGRKPGRGYRPPPPEEGHTGLSTVMLEIRSAAVDAERRLKAIAANEKAREKELATRSDEFQAELAGFVEGKKLKMTGGAEEAERVRQKRSENTLKAMFTGSGTMSPGGSDIEPMSPPPPPELG